MVSQPPTVKKSMSWPYSDLAHLPSPQTPHSMHAYRVRFSLVALSLTQHEILSYKKCHPCDKLSDAPIRARHYSWSTNHHSKIRVRPKLIGCTDLLAEPGIFGTRAGRRRLAGATQARPRRSGPSTTTTPTRLSPTAPCAGRNSGGRSGADSCHSIRRNDHGPSRTRRRARGERVPYPHEAGPVSPA